MSYTCTSCGTKRDTGEICPCRGEETTDKAKIFMINRLEDLQTRVAKLEGQVNNQSSVVDITKAVEAINKIQDGYMHMNKSYQRVKFCHLREVINALGGRPSTPVTENEKIESIREDLVKLNNTIDELGKKNGWWATYELPKAPVTSECKHWIDGQVTGDCKCNPAPSGLAEKLAKLEVRFEPQLSTATLRTLMLHSCGDIRDRVIEQIANEAKDYFKAKFDKALDECFNKPGNPSWTVEDIYYLRRELFQDKETK